MSSTTPNTDIQDFEYTDLGNAKRWLFLYGETYAYVPELGKWFRWNGVRWEEDTFNERTKTIDKFLQSIKEDSIVLSESVADYEDELNISNAKELKKIGLVSTDHKILHNLYESHEESVKWYTRSQSSSAITAMFSIAAKYGNCISYSEYDKKGHYIGTENCIVDLRNRSIVKDNPSYLMTNSCSVKYDPDAKCPNFIDTVKKALENDQETIAFFQRVIGQCALGNKSVSHLIILSGNGANLKSTIMDTIVDLLGDYSSVTTPDAITGNGNSKEYYLAELKGKRMTVMNESSRGAKLDDQTIKLLADSGMVQARFIYGKPFSYQNVATPILTTNFPPAVSSDYAIARRILFVPFNYQVPAELRNTNYRDEYLKTEMSGIFNWVLEGAQMYLKDGLNPPESILKATREYFFENDKVLQFVTESYNSSALDKVSCQDIHQSFVTWCESKGVRPFSSKRLNNELRSQGYDVDKSTGGIYYVHGISIRHTFSTNTTPLSPSEKIKKDIEQATTLGY